MTKSLTPIIESAVLDEAVEGVRQSVKIFKAVGLSNMQIAGILREAADELDPKIITGEEGHA